MLLTRGNVCRYKIFILLVLIYKYKIFILIGNYLIYKKFKFFAVVWYFL